jgi:hypothetical protein
LPLPAALTVSGVNGEKIDVTGYVEIPLQMEDGKTGKVRTFTRPVLVLSGIEQNDLILGYDFIQEEGTGFARRIYTLLIQLLAAVVFITFSPKLPAW